MFGWMLRRLLRPFGGFPGTPTRPIPLAYRAPAADPLTYRAPAADPLTYAGG